MEEPRSILKKEWKKSEEKLDIQNDNPKNGLVSYPLPSIQCGSHRLVTEIELMVRQQAHKARCNIDDKTLGWKVFLDDNDMKIYRCEEDINGILCYPIKAYYTVCGITGFELCHFFFTPKYRYDWDVLVDKMIVLEEIADDTLVFMQKYKKICFSSQRDSVFWSHMRSLKDEDENNPDQWIVVNHSTEHPDYEAGSSKNVRVQLTVSLLCQTIVKKSETDTDGVLTRDNVICKLIYCASINPGGWTSPALLKPFYKKEYPRFLKRLTTYAKSQTKNQSIRFD
ncbi:hypothetical protein HHI36_011794 [Cryptolaemus montrouzieri]|uniref:START domain-containing protein n=1 Tax=Cryptolaemus montrouzieri TaxID=559131 RepID=A0ABD2NDA2_9CUCU